MFRLIVVSVCTFVFTGMSEESGSISIPELRREKPVDFEREVLPLLNKNCIACHNTKEAKADLILETPATILKGGESGPSVIPGNGAESLLIKVSARQEKPFMPPRNNKSGAVALNSTELGLLKLWIDQGATGQVSTALGPVKWQPLPSHLKGVTAVAISSEGQYAAASRANQIFVYHLPSGTLVTRLTDPALLQSGYAKRPGIADRDIIQSLAFSPDGMTLASGAYRSVKLW
jgi:WD40 repeat protein